jgi:cytoskeletal protein CcmA (bactofilin family)
MKLFIITALTAFTTMVAGAQTTETRDAKPATALEVKNGIQVVLTQGTTPSLKVEAQSTDQLYNVATVYRKGTLRIYLKDAEGVLAPVKVYVTEPNITSVTAANGGSIKMDGRLDTETIDIKLAGGSGFNGEVNTTGQLHVKAASGSTFRGAVHAGHFYGEAYAGGVIKAVGEAATARVYSRGGTIHAGKLLTKATEAIALNGAAVFVYTKEHVKVETDAASTITYYGDPQTASTGDDTYSIQRDTQKLSLNN